MRDGRDETEAATRHRQRPGREEVAATYGQVVVSRARMDEQCVCPGSTDVGFEGCFGLPHGRNSATARMAPVKAVLLPPALRICPDVPLTLLASRAASCRNSPFVVEHGG